jgi:tellurite resistance protein TehA-like permease
LSRLGLEGSLLRGRGIANLDPGCFAFVMATGIVAIAVRACGLAVLASLLARVAVVGYVILWVLTLTRLVCCGPLVLADLGDHARGPGFFTLVAATCVLGAQRLALTNDVAMATHLWIAGSGLWWLLTYAFFAAVIVRKPKPGLEQGLHGGWLLVVVAMQAVSALGAEVTPRLAWREAALVFALASYLVGGLLYVLLISLIVYRLIFVPITAAALQPPYWINMGALAITTLAGATLLEHASRWRVLAEVLPFLEGTTLASWAAATWWIPLLLVLAGWRHLWKGVRFAYGLQQWAFVFPLGMYSACTFRLASVTGLSLLLPVARWFGYAALVAWAAAFCGLARRLLLSGR